MLFLYHVRTHLSGDWKNGVRIVSTRVKMERKTDWEKDRQWVGEEREKRPD